MTKSQQKIIIAMCAGEASGDLLGAHLIEALKRQYPQAQFVGIGGSRMKEEGFESLFDQEKLAVRGFAEVVKRLPEILSIRKQLIQRMKDVRPDVFVGIDAPDFNLHVEGKLREAGIATVHYVSPSVWAWRRERVNKIVHQANRVLCLFPMEAPLYEQAGGRAEFVGHPLAQTLPLEADKNKARDKMRLPHDIPVFTLMPGSRVSEIDYMAPIFLQTAQLLLTRYPNARFLVPVATAATRVRMKELLDSKIYQDLPIQMVISNADLACTAADVVLVTSGTATLEVALCKRPMVISYKISSLTYAYVKRKIKVPHVGLPNILLNKAAVPELLQQEARPALLANEIIKWYESPESVKQLQQDFHQLHLMLKKDTAMLAAKAVLAEAGFQTASPA